MKSDNEHLQGAGLLLDSLAALPERALLDEIYLSNALKVTPRTIRRMISRAELPPPIRLGGRSVWLAGKVLTHLEREADKAARIAERQGRRLPT